MAKSNKYLEVLGAVAPENIGKREFEDVVNVHFKILRLIEENREIYDSLKPFC
jgi:hypothetical protein